MQSLFWRLIAVLMLNDWPKGPQELLPSDSQDFPQPLQRDVMSAVCAGNFLSLVGGNGMKP